MKRLDQSEARRQTVLTDSEDENEEEMLSTRSASDFPDVPDDQITTLPFDQVADLVTEYGIPDSEVFIYGAPWASDEPAQVQNESQ